MSDDLRAKDALQDTLIQILQKINKYQNKGSFQGWIKVVASNKCLEILRKEKRHQTLSISEAKEPMIQENASCKLEQEEVMKFMDTLPEAYRIAINMYLVEGYAHREIATQLGISESSSRSLVSRGRKMILAAFEENNYNTITPSKNRAMNKSLKLKII